MEMAGANRVALLYWQESDGISSMMSEALTEIGVCSAPFVYGQTIPLDTSVVLSHGPHGELLPLWRSIAKAGSARPVVVHWNTEGPPDLRMPRTLMWQMSLARSRVAQMKHSKRPWLAQVSRMPPVAWLDRRMQRFRHVGDYDVARKEGLLDVLADSSLIYGRMFYLRGHSTAYLPWGTTPSIHADLNLRRDIDVLWMGKRGSARRSRLLDRVRHELKERGISIYMADNEEHPFIFGEARIEFLNRAKVTLNVTRTWYDDNFSRFAFAAPNRSLVVSEPLLPHCSEYQAGTHYVSAPVAQLADTIAHYVANDEERVAITDKAYDLSVTDLAFSIGMSRLMHIVEDLARQRAGVG